MAQPDPAEIGAVAEPAEGTQHRRRVAPDQVRRGRVGVAHRSLLNPLEWSRRYFSVTPESRCANLLGWSFDASVQALWEPLLAGATLVLSIAEVGEVSAIVVKSEPGGAIVRFALTDATRQALLQRLFGAGDAPNVVATRPYGLIGDFIIRLGRGRA